MENGVGCGFRPTDVELIGYFLFHKISLDSPTNVRLVERFISEVDIRSFDPWNLRFQAQYKSGDLGWYFFSRRENNSPNGNQKRTTSSGKWKLTGDRVDVKDQWGDWCGVRNMKIGHKRVLTFVDERSSQNRKSDWVIHEYHYDLLPENKRTHVICRLEYKGDDISIAKATDPTPTFFANNMYQDLRSNYCPKNPETGFLVDDSSDSDNESMVINTQKRECEWKMGEESIKKTPSINTVKPHQIVLGEMSQRYSQWDYHIISGFLVFISILGWIFLVG